MGAKTEKTTKPFRRAFSSVGSAGARAVSRGREGLGCEELRPVCRTISYKKHREEARV
jgi:hypothetical protein